MIGKARPEEPEPPDLLSTLPLGGLLAGVLRALLPADRREEFVGDLIEEANLRLRTVTRAELARWLWAQAVCSAPALVSWRIRRLALAPRAGTLVVAGRAGRRGLTLSLAVSVSAHAVVLAAAVTLILSRVEEIEPRFPFDVSASILEDPPDGVVEPKPGDGAFSGVLEQMRTRRLRIARRPVAPPRPLATLPADPATAVSPAQTAPAAPAVAAMAGPAAIAAGPLDRRGSGAEPRLRLPPRVGEKRCLSCPTPQLPHPYARLGIGQEMLVKTCVGVRGEVTSVKVLRGFDPVVDERVKATVRSWQLTPYSLDGHPVPFCYETRFLFTTH